MKRTIVLLVIAAMFLTPFTALAQDGGDEWGSGGALIQGNGGTSVGSLTDLSCSGTDCRAVTHAQLPRRTIQPPLRPAQRRGHNRGQVIPEFLIAEVGLLRVVAEGYPAEAQLNSTALAAW